MNSRHLVRQFYVFICATVLGLNAFVSADELNIYWVDVEGGAATLIVTPAGESILIDSGNPGRRDANRIFQVATGPAKLRQIDHLITTHYHGDHFGGAEPLSTLIPIRAVYDNGIFEGMPDKPSKEYFEFKAEKRNVLNPGFKFQLKQRDGHPPVSLSCVGCRQDFVPPKENSPPNDSICASSRTKDRDGSDNANSVVLVLDFGPFRFFDGGDLTWNQEARLVCPKNLIGEVDVYQVTHHGLDSSNNPLVVRSLKPTVAIMNNGVTKGCAPEVFTTLKETNSISAIFQLHKNMRPDGATFNVADEFIANLSAECNGNHVQLTVSADAKQYSVAIPATGKKTEFKTRVAK